MSVTADRLLDARQFRSVDRWLRGDDGYSGVSLINVSDVPDQLRRLNAIASIADHPEA